MGRPAMTDPNETADLVNKLTRGYRDHHAAEVGQGRFRCELTRADEPECGEVAKVTINDITGQGARACLQHAIAALEVIDGAEVDWDDSKGLNEYERKALELTKPR
jgi:hypothetical protein